MPILQTFDENYDAEELVNLITDKEVDTKKEFMSKDDYKQILSSWRNSNQLCEEEYRQKLQDTLGPGSQSKAYVNETKKYFAQYNEIASALTDKIKTNLVKKMNSHSESHSHSYLQKAPLDHKSDNKLVPIGENYENRFTSIRSVNKYRIENVGDRLNYGTIESEGSISEDVERQFEERSQLLNSSVKEKVKSMKKID